MITKFEDYLKLNEDDGGAACGSGDSGGGAAFATLGNTGGMGAVVAPQPGNIPGQMGARGSGDIPAKGKMGPYFKAPLKNKTTKRRKKKSWL